MLSCVKTLRDVGHRFIRCRVPERHSLCRAHCRSLSVNCFAMPSERGREGESCKRERSDEGRTVERREGERAIEGESSTAECYQVAMGLIG